jgi:ribosomal protein S18 acetylase RimI-like enzyme
VYAIDQARADEWVPALHLAYRHLPDEERRVRVIHAVHLIDAGELDPRGVLVARAGGTVAGVQVCVPLGGSTCLFWPPETRPEHAATGLADRLVQAGLTLARGLGCKLAQTLLPPAEADRAAALVRHDFLHVTRLLYLHHDLADPPPTDATPGLRFETYAPANEAAFREALGRTYVGTLDCPELSGIRTVDEILAGYRATPPYRPELWRLARADNVPAGLVIVTELPETGGWELSYLGVVPEFRRRGVGRGLVAHVVVAAREGAAGQLLVTVDERNAPARRLYAAAGFRPGEAREVYLRRLDGVPLRPA